MAGVEWLELNGCSWMDRFGGMELYGIEWSQSALLRSKLAASLRLQSRFSSSCRTWREALKSGSSTHGGRAEGLVWASRSQKS